MRVYAAYAGLVLAAAVAYRWGAGRAARPALACAAIAGASATAGLMLALTRGTLLGDFLKAYYHAGRVILDAPSRLYACDVSNLCFVNLPIVGLLFVPFAWLPPWPAGLVFSGIGIGAVVVAARMLTQAWTDGPPAPLAPARVLLLLLLNGPLYYSIRLGNTTHLLLPVLLLAFAWVAGGRGALGGTLLGALAVVKPPLALFLPYLLARRRLDAAAGMAGTVGVLVLVSIAAFGWPLHAQFWRDIVVGFGGAPVAAYNAQSLSGALAHLLMPGHLRNFEPLPPTPAFVSLRVLATGAVLLGTAAACWRAGVPSGRRAWLLELSMVLAVALLVAPISWTHYFLLLIVPMAGFASGSVAVHGTVARAGVGAAILLLSLPVTFFTLPWPRIAAVHERLFASHFCAGALLLLGLLSAARLGSAAARPAAVES